MKRLLITGAAGNPCSLARRRPGHLAQVLRLSDIDVMPPVRANSERFREQLDARLNPPAPTEYAAICQGGGFVSARHCHNDDD